MEAAFFRKIKPSAKNIVSVATAIWILPVVSFTIIDSADNSTIGRIILPDEE